MAYGSQRVKSCLSDSPSVHAYCADSGICTGWIEPEIGPMQPDCTAGAFNQGFILLVHTVKHLLADLRSNNTLLAVGQGLWAGLAYTLHTGVRRIVLVLKSKMLSCKEHAVVHSCTY